MDRTMSRGSVSIEVAVLAPAFLAMMVLAGVAGRTAVASEALEAAAHDAARAASISRDARTARTEALDAVRSQLDWRGLACSGEPQVTFSGSVDGRSTTFGQAFSSSVGQDATVTVQIACTVSYQDIRISVLRMPSGNRVTASFTSPLDRYRSRG
ncbi:MULTISPECIES: TadE/TadG family type IV pilus assembly protein [unclassified Micromonospora]|uniref:TadE/TadG family type IV pilus assembly protein n=2 Tax=unclassified Micromonospora TaxID=2617518 RepID=UPI001033E1F1|nr:MULTISPECIES: TadE/TadG family type IV pilus assembly protein [unclassified Micromonospora]QKW11524.1 pilus assembly protein [Verrucosispora sp. NA02020]QKW11648.1 pilus assembly protein [Verrucosispora sp. NA02020]TBL31843.1 pilus assembly protein [Verrucosispora sp. SN26_14.1]